MDLAIGVLLGIGVAALVAALVAAAWRSIRAPQQSGTPEAAMQSALHAASATLPYLRRGLSARTASGATPHLRALMGATAIALADTRAVLAIDGEGREQVRPGDLLSKLLAATRDNRLHIVPRLVSSDPACPLRSAVLAPLIVQEKRAGTLIAFYRSLGRPSPPELRVVEEAASLISAQVELSVVAAQEERLAQAELRALRAQISPHFIYNALAAVAGDIHARPEEARELLIDFAEFTRYLFRDGRSYVTLGEEIDHVERYAHLEQARFRDQLHVTIDVPESTRSVVVPAMSVQPLVENAVRHGVERRAGTGRVSVTVRVSGGDVELRVSDDGAGIEPERLGEVLAGAGGGIGLANVDARLRSTFGERYALRIESTPGAGTTAVMTVPNLAGEPAERGLSWTVGAA
ncbi:MAG: histidine kinase [Solirubrobacterales bacterium]|nr:histidine kinase [Solirubrobacterales bacterium]MBV9716392.1 histidine kinase [Solirubrobacterales bacterium]